MARTTDGKWKPEKMTPLTGVKSNGKTMFESLREVVQAESNPTGLAFALFAAFDDSYEKAPSAVRAAMREVAEEYEKRRGSGG